MKTPSSFVLKSEAILDATAAMSARFCSSLAATPDLFYKRGSQEKTLLRRLDVFLLHSPLDGAGSVLNCRTRCSVTGRFGPAVWVFSTSGFHRFFATKPVRSETSKAETVVKFGDHSSIRDSWPIASSGYPRGPRVGCETWCPKHAGPNKSAETLSRTRVSREPDGHRQRNTQRWSGLAQKHSSCLWFQMLGVEAHSSLPHDQNDRGNLPRQSQTCHFRPHALSH